MAEITKINSENNQYIKKIAELENKYFSQPLTEMEIYTLLANKLYSVYVLSENEQLSSYIIAYTVLDETHITSIASSEKRKGYAKRLLSFFISEQAKNDVSLITLEARMSNTAAVNLYRSMGFVCDGIRKNIYEKPKEDGLIMHRIINGEFN